MKISWTIEDGEMSFRLMPQSEGDKMALKFCDGFEGSFSVQNENGYGYGAMREVLSGTVTLRLPPKQKDGGSE